MKPDRPLRGQSVGDLVDALGNTRAQIAVLEGKEKQLKAELIERRIGEAEGHRFRMVLVSANRMSLDTAAVRRELGDRYEQFCRSTLVVSLKTTPRASALADLPAAA